MTTNQTSTPLRAEALERARVPGLLRRLASILYDLMLVSSILVSPRHCSLSRHC